MKWTEMPTTETMSKYPPSLQRRKDRKCEKTMRDSRKIPVSFLRTQNKENVKFKTVQKSCLLQMWVGGDETKNIVTSLFSLRFFFITINFQFFFLYRIGFHQNS
jgi:hypothetical protein